MTPKPDSNRLNTPARGQGCPLKAFCPLLTHIVTPSVSENVLDGKNHAQPCSRVLSTNEHGFEHSMLTRVLSVKTAVLGGGASRAFERSFGAKPSAKTDPNVLPLMSYPKPTQNRAQNPSAQDRLPTPSPTPADPPPPTTKRPSTAVLKRRANPRRLRQLVSARAPQPIPTTRSRCPSRGSSAQGSGLLVERLNPIQEAASYYPTAAKHRDGAPRLHSNPLANLTDPPRLRNLFSVCTPKQEPTLPSLLSGFLQNCPRPRDKDRHSLPNPKPTTQPNPTL